MIEAPADTPSQSPRLAEARERAAHRLLRQRDMLRPLGWAVIAIVVAGAAGAQPPPGLQGKGLGVALALCLFAATLAVAVRGRFTTLGASRQAALIAVMGAAGVALLALQGQGASVIAGSMAVWMAVVRLPLPVGVSLGAAVAAAIDAVLVVAGSSPAAVLATTALLAMIGLVAQFLKQARAGQDRTELLLAELEDAREEQTRAAALAERGRIAAELHDVLAHALSGAAIQLQAARKLAEHDRATPPTRAAIDRAGELVRDGLVSARQAVGALRGDALPGVEQLHALVGSIREDLGVAATLTVEGSVRSLPAETSLALYRGAQEALTNIARYAPGSAAVVVLRYGDGHTTLSVEDQHGADAPMPPDEAGLAGVGGGRGLAGLRERLDRVGGSVQAGPTGNGWRVDVDVPA